MSIKGSQFLLDKKRFIVTGAASGIGKRTAIVLAELGASLVLVDINEEPLNETKMLCGSLAATLLLNLNDTASIKDGLIRSATEGGKFDGLVHCAGIPYISPLKSIEKKKALEVYELNSYAALELSKVFTNRNVFNGISGSIVFISSVYGIVGSPASVGYAMSKAAIHGLTKALAIELAPKKIRVNCIAPGFVKTKMLIETSQSFEASRDSLLSELHPLGLGNSEDVANPIAFLLSDASKWITGVILSVDGGFTAQ